MERKIEKRYQNDSNSEAAKKAARASVEKKVFVTQTLNGSTINFTANGLMFWIQAKCIIWFLIGVTIGFSITEVII